MNFLRRVLGLSSESPTPTTRGDVISITIDNPVDTTPPEPVIEKPAVRVEPPTASHLEEPTPTESVEAGSAAAVQPQINFDIVGTRPLPPLETVIPKPGQRLLFGQLSDVGMVRGNNQDAVFSMLSSSSSTDDLPDFGLFIVADGMGGHHDGEKASAIATRVIARHVITGILSAILDQQMGDPDRPSIAEVLQAAVQKANDVVSEQIPEGGTTVTTTVIMGDMAYIAHVGDSRAYLITEERIEQVTRDHTLVQRLIELDQLTPEEAAEHPRRNVLYRAIGQNDSLDVDAITRRLLPRARLLLCSDGLWNLIPEETIREMVLKHSNPQEACNKLVQMANERGGPDNITVVIVQVPG